MEGVVEVFKEVLSRAVLVGVDVTPWRIDEEKVEEGRVVVVVGVGAEEAVEIGTEDPTVEEGVVGVGVAEMLEVTVFVFVLVVGVMGVLEGFVVGIPAEGMVDV